jgi:hypothetical protein
MKKSELKEIIRPIVAECVQDSVREILLESGLLATVISEVVKGTKSVLTEEVRKTPLVIEDDEDEDIMTMRRRAVPLPKEKKKIEETKKKLLDTVANGAYKGLSERFGTNLFEGITETIPDEVASTPGSALSGLAPNDPGVNIEGILDIAGDRWKANLNGKKKD